MRLICFNVNSWPPTAKNAAMSVTSATALSAAAAASKPAQARATSAALTRWLSERLDADVLCLQETKVSERKLAEIKELAVLKGYESFWSCSRPPRTGYSGTAIFCRSPKWSPTRCAEEEVLPATHIFDHIPGGEAAVEALGLGPSLLSPPSYEGEGRFLEVELGEDLTLINVYVPNAGDREADGGVRAGVKVAFLRALRRRVDEILAQASKEGKNRGVVLCGDLNLAAAREDVCLKFDFDGLYSPEEMSALRALMAPPMVDAFRRLHPEATAGSAEGQRGFTVWDQRSNARSHRISKRKKNECRCSASHAGSSACRAQLRFLSFELRFLSFERHCQPSTHTLLAAAALSLGRGYVKFSYLSSLFVCSATTA